MATSTKAHIHTQTDSNTTKHHWPFILHQPRQTKTREPPQTQTGETPCTLATFTTKMTDDTHQKNTRRLMMTEETHLYLTNHNYKLITFKNGKTTNFFMTATFCIFTNDKTNQTFNDSNILHFYTWQNKPKLFNDSNIFAFLHKVKQTKTFS